jgi:hypothetical protein
MLPVGAAWESGAMVTRTIEPSQSVPDDSVKVLAWRLVQLLRAGYDPDAAGVLAVEADVDLHAAISLVERGCPPKTALRILL